MSCDKVCNHQSERITQLRCIKKELEEELREKQKYILELESKSIKEQFTITHTNNFLRLFQIPSNFPEGFCFGGGKPTTFLLVNWFNPVPYEEVPSVLEGDKLINLRQSLRNFIKSGGYYNPARKYVAITDYGDSFII